MQNIDGAEPKEVSATINNENGAAAPDLTVGTDERNSRDVARKGPLELDRAADTPGELAYDFAEELTQAEYAIVAALRRARRVEGSWDACDQRDAWHFIHRFTEAVLAGQTEAERAEICDPDQVPLLEVAGVACAQAIRFLSALWKGDREETRAERASGGSVGFAVLPNQEGAKR